MISPSGKAAKPGPQVDRQLSAPLGGPTTLIDPDLYAGESGARAGQKPSKKPVPPQMSATQPRPNLPSADSSADRQT